MRFVFCLVFLATAGFASSQSTQEVRARSGYTQNGQCSYTFVLPPSSVQQCGAGQGEADLEQIREQVNDLQNRYQELMQESSDLRQQKEDLDQRLSALEGNIMNATQSGNEDYLPASCTEVTTRSGFSNQTFHVIDPDGPEHGILPMVVYCELQGERVVTLIGHDSEARTQVVGLESPGSYSRDVTYWNSMEQVRAVVDRSSLCKQLIKYECYGSRIWGSDGNPYAWWVTRDGRQADYWGGASPGSGKCACGESGTCSGRCNCDLNDNIWREDSGFLVHKDDLPVTQLRFGDTGNSHEEGYHTLGKLICYP